MSLRVRIEHGQDAGKTWRLAGPGAYRFGRTPQSSVQILDMKVSKDHLEIVVRRSSSRPEGAANGEGAAGATIRDLGSSHGTLLNAQPVTGDARPLSPGDEVRLGMTVLRVLSDGPSDAEAKPSGPVPSPSATSTSTASGTGGGPAGNAPTSGIGGTAGATAGAANGGAARPAGTAPSKPSASPGKPTASPAAEPRKALPPDALVGTTIAGYKILEKVGAGGMGAVYRAEQLSLHREVALKVLAEKLVSDSAFVDQFVNEARAAGQLNHPNVVQVYDVGQEGGRHFFSMEFIHGGPLEGRVPKTGKGVPWQDALGWFLDAANALIFAEKKGILHRDIKPDNFMLSQDGSVKLCDLGLAKKSESADLLAQGIIGTPHFISPEAIRRRADVDARSDLYSLGCTFYRLLTAKNPYPAGSVKEILLAHLNAPVPRASASAADLPKELDEVVFRLMQKDPAARFQSSEDLWKALDKIRLQHGLAEHGLHPGRAKRIAILAGVGGLIAVGVAVYFVFIKKPEVVTNTVIQQVGPKDAVERQKYLESQARNALLEIQTDAAGLGDIQTSYPKAEWAEVVRRYEELAAKQDYAATQSAADAKQRAEDIRKRRESLITAAQRLDTAKKEAVSALDLLVKNEVGKIGTLRREGKLAEADEVAKAAVKAVEKAGRSEHDGVRLLPEEAVTDARSRLTDARKMISDGLKDEFEKTERSAKATEGPGTAPALEAAIAEWKRWLEAHPAPAGDDPEGLPGALRNFASLATKAVDGLTRRREEVAHADTRQDRARYHTLMQALYREPVDGAPGGALTSWRFADAAAAVATQRSQAKTDRFKARLDVLLDGANRLAAFGERFPKAVPTPLALQGASWKGSAKEVKVDAVVVDGTTRRFEDEGVAFFFGLFYETKGGATKERFPLDADAHEALALVASIAVVSEGAEHLARVEAEAARAVEMDLARKARLDAIVAEAKAEAAARTLWDEAWKTLSAVNAEMARILAKIDTVDERASKAGRDEAIQKEAELKVRLQSVRDALAALQEKHPGSVVLAVRVDVPPPRAVWAGETPPPEPTKPPPPAPTPAPGAAPAPAPADPAGMATDPQSTPGLPEGPGMGGDGPGMGGDAPGMAEPPGANGPGKDAPPAMGG